MTEIKKKEGVDENTQSEIQGSNSGGEKIGIYEKVRLIQEKIKKLSKTEKNVGQNYDFFNEKEILDNLKPLLSEYKLSIHASDDPSQPFFFERNLNTVYVRYLKKIEIIDCESHVFNVEEFNKQQTKGSAETYGMKYFLQKYFVIPAIDKSDPDFEPKQVTSSPQQVKIPIGSTVQVQPTQTGQVNKTVAEARQLYKLYTSVTAKDFRGTKINSFFEFFNSKIAPKIGISEKIHPGNLAKSLETLDDANYQENMNEANKILDAIYNTAEEISKSKFQLSRDTYKVLRNGKEKIIKFNEKLEADISQFNLKELVAQNKIKELQALSDALAGFTNTFIGTVQLEVSRSNFAKQEKS
ncbi:17520_t:CDS:2 [Funneliformis geosporum]|nr:17520_t:CDS:2 [Funneliformis geosporum]